jgi:PilZ domain
MAGRTNAPSRRSGSPTPGRKGAPPTPPVERRQAPRLDVLWQLNVEILFRKMPVSVREIGANGFSIETTTPIPEGERMPFRFSLDGGVSAVVLAESVHDALAERVGDLDLYVTGFKFVDVDIETKNALDQLLEQIQRCLAVAQGTP